MRNLIGEQKLTGAAADLLLLLGNPSDHKTARAQRSDRGCALIKGGELIDEEFAPDFLAVRREDLSINIAHARRTDLVKTAPDNDNVAIVERRDGRIDLVKIGRAIDHDIATGPNIAGREESGVDVLVTIFAALPDEGRPAAVEERD